MVNGDLAGSPVTAWRGEEKRDGAHIAAGPAAASCSESIHPGNSIEWWFVHGSFSGASIPLRYFMISIFRYDSTPEKKGTDDGYYLILSLLDTATGKNHVVSRGERRIIDRISARRDGSQSTNLDRDLVDTYIDEMTAYGPPEPVTLENDPPLAEPGPFSFAWNGVSLRTDADGISLAFGVPGIEGECRFRLAPRSGRYCMDRIGTSPERSMTCITRPGLSLTGCMGDEPVTGTAWSDHQWGNTGCFLSQPGSGDLLGWDWAGISGSDGTHWMFITFHNPEDGGVLGQQAFMFGNGREVTSFGRFHVRPLRFWTSPKTRIRYPVAMEIIVPEADARFVIEPVADDQEIPVLGLMRAVWEGAATCAGTAWGLPFTGSARLELHGYGYIFSFRDYLAGHIDRIRASIDEFIPGDSRAAELGGSVDLPQEIRGTGAVQETIVRPCRDLLLREKKYWRPVFSLLLLETLGVRSDHYLQLLSVVPELTHTATLIIDDIEDDAEIRRGDTCIHRRYGTDVAINAANTLYFLPSILYNSHPDLTERQRLDFYRITLDSFIRGHFGQAQDIFWTRHLSEENLAAWSQDHLTEKILQMYELKTATAAVAMAEAGCILAGSAPGVRDACVMYARAFGTAFQIADDIQSFEPSSGTGTMPCDDIAAGKVTYVIARALALLEEDDRKTLIRVLCSPEMRRQPEFQEEGIALVMKSGALGECRSEAQAMVDNAWHAFSGKIPPSEAKVMLRLFSKNLVRPSGTGSVPKERKPNSFNLCRPSR